MSNLIEKRVYTAQVKKVNTAFGKVRKSNTTLFSVIREAYDLMAENHKKDWKRFKLDVDCDESTFNKIVKVVSTDFVMSNLDVLPLSWSTLHAIAVATKDHLKTLESALVTKDEDGVPLLNPRTTKSALVAMLANPDPDKKSGDTPTIVRFDSSKYDETQLRRLKAIMEELESNFGFTVTDSAKTSDDTSEDVKEAA